MKRLMEEIRNTRKFVKSAVESTAFQGDDENYVPALDPQGPGHQGPVFDPPDIGESDIQPSMPEAAGDTLIRPHDYSWQVWHKPKVLVKDPIQLSDDLYHTFYGAQLPPVTEPGPPGTGGVIEPKPLDIHQERTNTVDSQDDTASVTGVGSESGTNGGITLPAGSVNTVTPLSVSPNTPGLPTVDPVSGELVPGAMAVGAIGGAATVPSPFDATSGTNPSVSKPKLNPATETRWKYWKDPISLEGLGLYTDGKGHYFSDAEGKNAVDNAYILNALAQEGGWRLPTWKARDPKMPESMAKMLSPYYDLEARRRRVRAYNPLIPENARKTVADIWWGADDEDLPVLKYRMPDNKVVTVPYDEAVSHLSDEGVMEGINAVYPGVDWLVTDEDKGLVSNLNPHDYAYSPEGWSGRYKLFDDGRVGRPVAKIPKPGEVGETVVYAMNDGSFQDADGNEIDLSDRLADLGWSDRETGSYSENGVTRYMPVGLRSRVVDGGDGFKHRYFFDPVTYKRVTREDMVRYPGYVTADKLSKVPTFQMSLDNPFTGYTMHFEPAVPTDMLIDRRMHPERYPQTYKMVITDNAGNSSTPTGMDNLTAEQIQQEIQPDFQPGVEYPFRNGTLGKNIGGARSLTVEPTGDSDNPYKFTAHFKGDDGEDIAIPLDLNNPYHREVIGYAIDNPSYTQGGDGPTVHHLVPTADGGFALQSDPYEFGAEQYGADAPLVPVSEASSATPPVDPAKMNEEEKTIFTDKVKKYIALGIPVGLAVSMAMWALGGAKSENMLGALAAGAGGGALLGGLGAHLGYLGNEEDATEEGAGSSEPSERTPEATA